MGCILLTKIKANTVNTCLLYEIVKKKKKKKTNIYWEHNSMKESHSFLPFLVVYYIFSETEERRPDLSYGFFAA